MATIEPDLEAHSASHSKNNGKLNLNSAEAEGNRFSWSAAEPSRISFDIESRAHGALASGPGGAWADDAVNADRSGALDVLDDPIRRALVERLAEGPSCVALLATGLPVSRTAVSQHLRILLDAGVVGYRKQGARNVYSLNPEPLIRLERYLAELCGRMRRTAAGPRAAAVSLQPA